MLQTKICILNKWETMEEFLKKGLLLSRSSLKNSTLKKSFLNKVIKEKEEISLPLNLLNKGIINPFFDGEDIDIIFEDEMFWVVNKPNSIHGHPLSYCENDNILSFLRNKNSNVFLGSRDENMERGLLYRLDNVTSGLLIIAKDELLSKKLRDSFKVCAKKKAYIAIVEGEFNLEGRHTHFFKSQGVKGHKVSVNTLGDGSEGSLIVTNLAFNEKENLSLIYVELETGLRHQIRAQMAALGFPLLGDELYDGKKERRVYLHALHYQLIIGDDLKEWTCEKAPLFDCFFDVHCCLKMLGQ